MCWGSERMIRMELTPSCLARASISACSESNNGEDLATWASCLFSLGRADYNGVGGALLNTEWVLAYIRLRVICPSASRFSVERPPTASWAAHVLRSGRRVQSCCNTFNAAEARKPERLFASG